MLKMVVLPAPFGPIRPFMSPSAISNDALLTARRPRNDFEIERTSSRAMFFSEDPRRAGEAGERPLADRARNRESDRRPERGEGPLDEDREGRVDEVVPLHSFSLL